MGIKGDVVTHTTSDTIVLHSGAIIEKEWLSDNSDLPFNGIRAGDVLSLDSGNRVVFGTVAPTRGVLTTSIKAGTSKDRVKLILSLKGFSFDLPNTVTSLESNGVIHYRQVAL